MNASLGTCGILHPAADKGRLIDALRGFAALLVAYFHCRQIIWVGMQQFQNTFGHALDFSVISGYLTLPFTWGSAGVPIFFVISGYCIHYNAAQRLACNPAHRLDTSNFWARRWVRIYPVLIAALLLTLALDAISLQFAPVSHKIQSLGPTSFLVNLFSLQGIAGSPYGSNGALWTLSLEVQFYALYPLLFAARRRFGMRPVLAAVASINLVSAWFLERHNLQFCTSYWLSWTLGAYIADVYAHASARKTHLSRHWYSAAFILITLGCGAFHFFGQYTAFQLWALGFTCYLYRSLAHPIPPGIVTRALAWLGTFSYSLYLIHMPLFVCLGSFFYHSRQQLAIWPSFGFLLFSIPVAYLFYRTFELPAMTWAARLKRRQAAAAIQPLAAF